MAKTVACIGEMLWDVFGTVKKPGGSSLNVALNLQKQGIESKFISAVGKDELGQELLTFIKEQGLNSAHIQCNELPTSTVLVTLDKRHQASYNIVQPVAWDKIQLTDENKNVVQQADALVYCSLTCREETSRNTVLALAKQAKLKIFDINLRTPHYAVPVLEELLQLADVLKLNDDEIEFLRQALALEAKTLEDLVKVLSKKFNIPTICLTLGANGAIALHNGQIYSHPGFEVTVTDTVGAGDAFLATFIAGYLSELPLPQILERACKVGAFVASQPGANPTYGTEVFG